ncbi:MAG TPA: sigma-70 family RNA polymerase sigma factor [Kofleriaceae bacterium]|nr:sigma-70 family RNA polymerase sigma factor [Kofleriaceae bacterium]
MQADLELLAAWASGDAGAGREFYGRYAQRIARFFARKLPDEAADRVQRTFLKCLEVVKAGREVGDPGALLFAIARNELHDALRARMRDRDRFDPDEVTLEQLGTAPPDRLARRQEQATLLRALRQLPIDDQLALELYYWEDMPMERIGQVLGISRTAAVSRVHRARQLLRDLIGRLQAAPDVIADTLGGFETWARSLRED